MMSSEQPISLKALCKGVALAAMIPAVTAHSWVEQVRRIASNGTLIGEPGYPRGMVDRNDPGFNDGLFVHLLPPNGRAGGPVITDDDNISKHPVGDYTDKFPMIKAAPGELVALRYQENGHVSLPDNQPNKPLNRGTVFIYGTSEPQDDDKLLSIHRVWNTEGTGGDGRGRLIATRNYDDGQCHQENNGEIATARKAQFPKTADALQGTGLWCQVDVRIPDDVDIDSTYTLYWVWDWPTLTPQAAEASRNGIYNTQGENVVTPEVYTSVVDVAVIDPDSDAPELHFASTSNGNNKGTQGASSFIKDQDVTNRAIAEQMNNMFLVDPNFSDSNPSGPTSSGTASSAPSSTSAASGTPSRATNSGSSTFETSRAGQKTVTVTADPVTMTVTVNPDTNITETSGADGPQKTVTVTADPVTITKTVGGDNSRKTVTVTVDLEPTTLFATVTSTFGVEATALPNTTVAKPPQRRRNNWRFGHY